MDSSKTTKRVLLTTEQKKMNKKIYNDKFQARTTEMRKFYKEHQEFIKSVHPKVHL